jgi:hypothetical protein
MINRLEMGRIYFLLKNKNTGLMCFKREESGMKVKFSAIIIICLFSLVIISLPVHASGIAVSQTLTGITTDLNHPVGYLIDGNPSTYWRLQDGASEGWVVLTLAQPALIYGLKLDGSLGSGAELMVEYQSKDEWLPFTAAKITQLPSDGLIDLSRDRAITQNIRLRLSGDTYVSGYLVEAEILGEPAAAVFHRLRPAKLTTDFNTASNAPVYFLSDNNTYTGWRLKNSAIPGTAVFEFPAESTINNVNFYFSNSLSGQIKVEAFIDNAWRQAALIYSQPAGWYRLDLRNNSLITTRVRLTVSGYTALSEVEFWGYGGFSRDTRQVIGDRKPIVIAPAGATNNTAITNGGIRVLFSSANTSPITNSIQHNLKLINTGTANLNLSDVKLRYWYTNETAKPQIARIYWATIGSEKVTTQFVTVSNKANADSYLELGFTATAGTLAPGGSTEIKLGLNASDWTSYNQQNDFSFTAVTSYVENVNYTGYVNNTRAWGKEPDAIADTAVNMQFTKPTTTVLGNKTADGRLKVLYQSANPAATTNSIQSGLKFENTGYETLDLTKVKLRYWYTNETQKQQIANIYWASNGTNKVKAGFGTAVGAAADTYLELGFAAGTLQPGSSVEIKLGINAANWSNYIQTNDYSFANISSTYGENTKITAYIDNQLAWGMEPDTRPVFDNNLYQLELAFAGTLNETAVVELNGVQYKLDPAVSLCDYTIYCLKMTAGQLWDGVNHLRIKPFNNAVTLENAFVSLHDSAGECALSLASLSDGLLLTPATAGAAEWQLDQPILIEEATVTSADHSTARLYAWVNDNWTELTNWHNVEWGTRFTGPVTTNKLKLEPYGSVCELLVKGSVTTDQAPTVKILWPAEGTEVSLKGWANQELIGLVDNTEATVNVNNVAVTLDGHFFTFPLSKVSAKNGETVTLTATAQDAAGRTGSATIAVTAGEYTDVTLDQADTLVYTAAAGFTISGTVNQPAQYQINVDGTRVTISGNRFVTSVNLKEGLNLIEAQCIKNGQLVKTFYRRVIRVGEVLGLTITSSEKNSFINAPMLKVCGSVTGAAPLQVTVNGVVATVEANTYAATVPLTEGSNRITAVARDVAGKTAAQTITVKRDTAAPVISEVTPAEGEVLTAEAVTVTARISDANQCWVMINGQAVVGNASLYQTVLYLPDSNQTITITAQDAAGNTTTVTVKVVINALIPLTPEALKLTLPEVEWYQDEVSISAVVNYESLIAAITLLVDGEMVAIAPEVKNLNYVLDTYNLANGDHTVTVLVRTPYGLEVDKSRTISVDNPLYRIVVERI